jgi:hypothetical protein
MAAIFGRAGGTGGAKVFDTSGFCAGADAATLGAAATGGVTGDD